TRPQVHALPTRRSSALAGLVLRADLAEDLFFALLGDLFAAAFEGGHFDLQKHLGGLVATHYGHLRAGPAHDQARVVGLAAHGVVARAVAVAHDHGEFRHHAVALGVHHLGAVLYDAAVLAAAAHHE